MLSAAVLPSPPQLGFSCPSCPVGFDPPTVSAECQQQSVWEHLLYWITDMFTFQYESSAVHYSCAMQYITQPIIDWVIGVLDFLTPMWNDIVTKVMEWADWLSDEVWGMIGDVFESITYWTGWVCEQVGLMIGYWDPAQGRFKGGFLGWLWDTLAMIGTQVSAILGDVSAAVTAGFEWAYNVIFGWFDGLCAWLTDVWKWAEGVWADTAAWVVDCTVTAFDGAVNTMMGIFQEWPTLLTDVLKTVWDTFNEFIKTVDLTALQTDATAAITTAMASLITMFTASSPRTPEEAFTIAESVVYDANATFLTQSTSLMVAEAASLGQMDITLQFLMNTPTLRAWYGLASDILKEQSEISLLIPMRQYYLRAFTPNIPNIADATRMLWRGIIDATGFSDIASRWGYGGPYDAGYLELTKMIPGSGDLILFVVREVITPDDFTTWMGKQGFSEEWSKAYWDAHWVLPAADMLYDAFHRGVISEAELNKFVVWHDYSLEPRPGIAKSDLEIMAGIRKRLIPRVDLRRGWELGAISDEDLLRRYEWLGYEEDAPLMAEIQKRTALDAEIGKLRDNAKKDYTEGLITVDTLRANLTDMGYSPILVEYHTSDALSDQQRAYKKDLVSCYVDSYLKDLITEEQLRDYLNLIIVQPEVVDLIIDKAYVRKYSKPKPPKEAEPDVAAKEVYKYTVAMLVQQYRRYVIEKPELISSLVEAGMDPTVASARADYEEIRRPVPAPPPEEIAAAKQQDAYRKAQERVLIAQYDSWVIEYDALVKGLMGLKYDEATATAKAQYEYLTRPAKPVTPEELEMARTEANVRRYETEALVLYYRGYTIEKEGLIAGLILLDYTPAEAKARADYEEARRPPVKPTPEEIEAQKQAAAIRKYKTETLVLYYRNYTIEKDELISSLIELGYTPDEAKARADYEEVRRPAVKPTPEEIERAKELRRVTTITENENVLKFRVDIITADELRTALTALGYIYELVEAIIRYEEVKKAIG